MAFGLPIWDETQQTYVSLHCPALYNEYCLTLLYQTRSGLTSATALTVQAKGWGHIINRKY